MSHPHKRITRYQGAIIQAGRILLIRHTEHAGGHGYWAIPGGGIELGETEEACVCREMFEETALEVQVERLLLDEAGIPGGVYQRLKTYLCRIISGEASPGHEPEDAASDQANYAITAVAWFDLRDSADWGAELCVDPITFPLLQRIRAALGYLEP